MFKKKIWKRGDKLTVKELNRIEDGIVNGGSGGGDLTVTCILSQDTQDGEQVYSIDNTTLSSSISDIMTAIKNN